MAPSVIWDLAEDASAASDAVDVESLKQQASRAVIAQLEAYRGEILKERLRQAAIKEKYGIKSLDYLIVELDGDLIQLYERKDMGDNVDLVIRNKEDRKNKYAASLEELTSRIEKEKGLTMSMPRFTGIIRVTPADIPQGEMRESAEIEQIGMETAMAYEMQNRRTPQDVSAENLGFDIRSVDEELTSRIEKEKGLTMSMPRFTGIIRVTPADMPQGEMRESAEIEQIGMETAMAYEMQNRRTPQDVSAENLGFDIRSVDEEKQEIRYIEVKARAGTGPVALTQNEWFKAQRFKDAYYLYAVMNAATGPQLYMVRNPAENLEPEERVEVVRYVVQSEQIKAKGEKTA